MQMVLEKAEKMVGELVEMTVETMVALMVVRTVVKKADRKVAW